MDEESVLVAGETAAIATNLSIEMPFDEKTDEVVPVVASMSTPQPMVWSERLATPTVGGDEYSPSREFTDNQSLHGAGLQKALDHGKMVAKGGRRCSTMLLESASCYEQFGVSLRKACQTNPLEGDAFQAILSLSQQTRQLANLLREDIALPLQGYHGTMAETIPAMAQKYQAARQRAYGSRQRALLARNKYLTAVEEAEGAVARVQKVIETTKGTTEKDANNNKDTTAATNNTTNKNPAEWEEQLEQFSKVESVAAADRVSHLLNDVKVLQKRYESLVAKENDAVAFCQKMETLSLESLQKLQEQRLCTFYDSLLRTFAAIQEALDKLTIPAESNFDDSNNGKGEQLKVKQQKKGEFFSAFLKVGATAPQQVNKTGVTDATALGLEEEVGKLRDEVQTRVAQRLARIKKVKALATFFDDLSAAATKLGDGLQVVVKHEDAYVSSKGTPVEHLRTILTNNEGPRTLSLWNDLLKTIEKESEASYQFSRVLKSIKSSKLDKFLLTTSEKHVKDAAELDDGRWKHLCDAAKAAMRAESKYQQNSAQMAKARERVRSVDMDATSVDKAAKSPQKVNRAMDGMNKAFGNFLSILPDGGEGAMQILTPDARRAVAERAAKEADEKEMKGRQVLDTAIAYKAKAMATYKTKTQPLVKQYEHEEMSGVEDIKASMESLVSSLKTLQTSRYESLKPFSELEEQPLASVLAEDIDEWVNKASKDVSSKKGIMKPNDTSPTTGFMLSVVLAESEAAKQVLKFARSRSDTLESETSLKDDVSEGSGGPTSVRVAADNDNSSPSLDLNAVKLDDESRKGENSSQQGSRFFQKSFPTSKGKPVFNKKFRKFHSTGEMEKEVSQCADAADAPDDMTEISTVSTTVPPQNSNEITETEVFMAFWTDFEGAPPGVTDSFNCAFLPKDFTKKSMGSLEHGRLFLTHRGAVFVSWRGKKAILQYSLMTGVEKHESIFGLADDTLLVKAQSNGTLLLGCFSTRDKALQIMQERITQAKARAETDATKKAVSSADSKGIEESASTGVPVSPDPTLAKMEIVCTKKIRGVPVNKFHEIVWSESGSEDSFYGGWLGSGGNCNDIKVDEWETSDAGFTGPWCGETYTHKRQVNFQLKRNSMIGPPVAGVKQTQYCRLDDKDRSVMQMAVEFQGIPYSDTFHVEVRWVATRSGTKDLDVKVGVHVEFRKSTLLKSQIRSGTLTETKPVHESLFKYVKNALSKEIEAGEVEGDNEEDEGELEKPDKATEHWALEALNSRLPEVVSENLHIAGPAFALMAIIFVRWLFFFSTGTTSTHGEIAALHKQMADMQAEMKLMRESIEQLTEVLKKR